MATIRAHEYLQMAEHCHEEMLHAQAQVEMYEQQALILTGGDRIAAAKNYLTRTDNDAGWLYNNAIASRNMWAKRANLAATMAMARMAVIGG